MTKIKVIARVRPFLPHENVDDVVSVKEGTLVVKDSRVGSVTSYPYVLLREGILLLTPTSGRGFAASYDQDCSHRALFEEQVDPLLSCVFKGFVRPLSLLRCVRLISPLEDCVRVLLWRQLVGKDHDYVRKQCGPGHCPSGGPGEHPLRSSLCSMLMSPRTSLIPKLPTLTWMSKSV